jgi:catechol 2,3-dioxygenase
MAESAHPQTFIGHIHLKVSDLNKMVAFYRDVLGFEVMMQIPGAAFLSFGGYHHHLGMNTWESAGGQPPPPNATGLYHFAILYPNRKELARAVKRLMDNKWTIDGASDHGVSEAIYLRDPEENGIEIYADRPKEKWYDAKGKFVMYTKALNFDSLMAELADGRSA